MAEEPTARARILVIEDSAPELLRISEILRGAEYDVEVESSGTTGLDAARRWQPDVVVLDLGLPDMDGMEVCEALRDFSNAYVVMLTGRDDDDSRFAGLSRGADAYVTKPFTVREILVPIEVLLRRPRVQRGSADTIEIANMSIEPDARRVLVDGDEIKLTKIEFGLLSRIVQDPGAAVSRAELMAHIWGPNWSGGDHGISVHMANLRKKLDPKGPSRIETVRGVGYRLAQPGDAMASAS